MNGHVLLHVDMDAFFASVEQHVHPEWRGRPVIVGSGPHERGVVSTCSYEARRFGVHSAMPSRTAYAKCPQAIFTPPDMVLYQTVSEKAFEVFARYSPYVEGVSVDEAFLDITGTLHRYASPQALGEALRADVRAACGVTCSVGIAPNRLLAKIGSEQHKPDGLTVMPFEPEAIAAFLAPKPLGILWGVGAKTIEALRPFGVATCGDVQRLGADRLAGIVGETAAESLCAYAFGRSSDVVNWEEGEEKSVSREHTFDEDETDRDAVRDKLLELVEDVGRRFRREMRWARTARLKLRDGAFESFTRQRPLEAPARDDATFRAAALALFDAVWPVGCRFTRGSVRLVGFGVTNFQDVPDDAAPTLFETPVAVERERRERLSATIDALRARGMSVDCLSGCGTAARYGKMRSMKKHVLVLVACCLCLSLAAAVSSDSSAGGEPRISVFAKFVRMTAAERGISLAAAADRLYDIGVRGYDCGPDEDDLETLAKTRLRPINFYYFPDWFGRGLQDWNSYYSDRTKPADCIALAKRYGIPRIMVVPPSFTDHRDNPAEFEKILAHMKEFVALAKKSGITVTVEDYGGAGNCCSYAKYLKRLLNEIPDLQFALDSGNLLFAGRGEDILDMMAFAKGRIGHVHLKDQTTDGRSYVTLGLGCVPNEKIVRAMKAAGYAGWYTLENSVGDTYTDTIRQTAVLRYWLGFGQGAATGK